MDDYTLFPEWEKENKPDDWREHFKGMPEYDNVKKNLAKITVKINFLSEEDFNNFHELLKKHIYNNQRVFDGNQRENKKVTWYPLRKKIESFYIGKEDEK